MWRREGSQITKYADVIPQQTAPCWSLVFAPQHFPCPRPKIANIAVQPERDIHSWRGTYPIGIAWVARRPLNSCENSAAHTTPTAQSHENTAREHRPVILCGGRHSQQPARGVLALVCAKRRGVAPPPPPSPLPSAGSSSTGRTLYSRPPPAPPLAHHQRHGQLCTP